ncbi:MAG TPA: extracellular solute-binding protein [Gemmatimonadaceae bacterium]|nr:extracellular solute-binding protein [Gemmatimonadaceae bacterium]
MSTLRWTSERAFRNGAVAPAGGGAYWPGVERRGIFTAPRTPLMIVALPRSLARRPALRVAALALPVLALAACGRDRGSSRDSGNAATAADGRASTIVVFNAGSLARPMRAALDRFAAREQVTVEQESAGSLETARKLTELGHVPDVVALADAEVFPQLLMPAQTTWYAEFARNRMVVAYTDRSKDAADVAKGADGWWRVLTRPGIEVGRADPNLDPNGYRTLLVLQLAERHYRQPGLAARLLAASPDRDVRPKEADLVALLQAGELDYIWSYESLAQAAGLRYVTLPAEIDLGTPADSALYGVASVKVRGKTPRDTVVFRGQPIVYAFSIPRAAPHQALAERFAAFLVSDEGRRVLRDAKLDALDRPIVVGSGAPAALSTSQSTAR